MCNLQNVRYGTRIYILYYYELYKVTIKIYVNKYDWVFSLWQKDIFHCWFKRFDPYLYNHNKSLYIKCEFLENHCIYHF